MLKKISTPERVLEAPWIWSGTTKAIRGREEEGRGGEDETQREKQYILEKDFQEENSCGDFIDKIVLTILQQKIVVATWEVSFNYPRLIASTLSFRKEVTLPGIS